MVRSLGQQVLFLGLGSKPHCLRLGSRATQPQ